jgi:ABC-type multidrug transport system ATPase subunit
MKLFDKIILLSAGRTLFYGTLDEALVHFAALDFKLPPKTNPCDFFLDVITPGMKQ